MSAEERGKSALYEVVATARSMLSGQRSFIEGSRRIAELSIEAGLRDDPDVVPIIAVDSETHDLPWGETRRLWQASALDKLRPETERAEAWARGVASVHCQNLIQRFPEEESGRSSEHEKRRQK